VVRSRIASAFLLALALSCGSTARAQQPLDNSAVIKLTQSGLSEDLIVQTIAATPGHYDTTADGLIALKKAGITDKEVGAMLTKNASNSAPATGPVGSSAAPTASPVAANAPDTGKLIPKSASVYIAPMNGFETYLISALDKKQVPLTVVGDRTKADFEITGNADSQKAGWAKTIVSGSSRSTEEASINVTNLKSGTVVFAYNVNKDNSFHGKQSTAEACAKHLKEKIESGK